MRWLAPIAIILILSACIEPPLEQPEPQVAEEELEELGVQEETSTGLETMPEYETSGEDTSLIGETMDLGSLI